MEVAAEWQREIANFRAMGVFISQRLLSAMSGPHSQWATQGRRTNILAVVSVFGSLRQELLDATNYFRVYGRTLA